MSKRIGQNSIAALLAAVMVFTAVPVSASASEAVDVADEALEEVSSESGIEAAEEVLEEEDWEEGSSFTGEVTKKIKQ